jgi:hypothetical protein
MPNKYTQKVGEQMNTKKNLVRINVVVTRQTLWHLRQLAAMAGWGEKDLGRVIDHMVRTWCEGGGRK